MIPFWIAAGWLMAGAAWVWAWISRGVGVEALALLRRCFPFIPDTVWMRWGSGFHHDVPNDAMPTPSFFVLFFLMFGLYAAAVRCRPRAPRGRDLVWVLGIAALLRAVLFFSVPVHENDFYRYLWDGRVFSAGVNPYRYAPMEITSFSHHENDPVKARLHALMQEDRVLFDRIGYPSVVTIYPPAAQLLFALSVLCFGPSLWGWKVTVLLGEAGLIAVLVVLLRASGRPVTDVLIYAWSPLALKEFANSAHLDAAAMALMAAGSLGLWVGRRRPAAGLVGAATGIKYFPVLLLAGGRRLLRWRDLSVFTAVIIMLFLPFWIWQGAGARVFAGLKAYHEHWVYHPFLFGFIHTATAGVLGRAADAVLPQAKFMAALLYGVVLGGIVYNAERGGGPLDVRERFLKASFLSVGWLFLFSPAAYPWYLCWVLPFLCFFPDHEEWILLTGLVALTYWSFRSEAVWWMKSFGGITRLAWVVYGPFCALGLWRIRRGAKRPLRSA